MNGPAASSETVPGTGGDSEPSTDQYIGNKHLFQGQLQKLDRALGDVITTIEGESTSMGSSGGEEDLLAKLKGWRRELDGVRRGGANGRRVGIDHSAGVPAEKGGLFTD